MQTIFVIAFFGGLLLAQAVLWALLLRVGLRWAKAPDVSIRRIALATVLVVVLEVVLSVPFFLISPRRLEDVILFLLAGLALTVCVPAVVIMRVFKISFGRSLQAWLPTFGSPAIGVAFSYLVVQPYIFATHSAGSISTAPTLLPHHWTGKCTDCGNPAYGAVMRGQLEPPRQLLAICETNFHATQPTEYDRHVSGPDRFLVAKYLKPRRWDLVAFQLPENPGGLLHVKRLVGLPGEEITIRDGQVYANGKLLRPPESIGGISYPLPRGEWGDKACGTPDKPAKLADDEYFVLGDFSQRSKDSRLWDQGAPGHNPFAVPESHLRGVVTHIYWPLRRWRAFR